ncbi:MAG: hypothetical protein ACM3O4_00760 [Ignavibacteriales bacterium]
MMNIYDKNKKVAIVINDNEVIKIMSCKEKNKAILIQCIKGKLVIKKLIEKEENKWDYNKNDIE